MSEMLYYPSMSPSEGAIRHAVLYWDQLSTIVPEEYEALVTPDVLRLRDAGLWQPTCLVPLPDKHIDPAVIRAVLGELERTLPRPELDVDVTTLYPQKFSSWIADTLLRRGLARWSRVRTLDCLEVPRRVSYVLLSTIAHEYAARDSLDGAPFPADTVRVVPYTDDERAHRIAHDVPPEAYHVDRRPVPSTFPAWEVDVGRLLPVPAPGTDLDTLLEFRRRHEDERRRLMLAIEMLLHGLRHDPEHSREVYRMVHDYLDEAVRELEAAGRSRKIAWTYRSLSVLIAFAASAVGERLLPGTGWALGTIGGMAVNVATTEVRGVPTEYERVSYLARVRREFPPFAPLPPATSHDG